MLEKTISNVSMVIFCIDLLQKAFFGPSKVVGAHFSTIAADTMRQTPPFETYKKKDKKVDFTLHG